jgi:excisionase family DNA binding protein
METLTFEQVPAAICQLYSKLERIEKLLNQLPVSVIPKEDQLLTVKEAAALLHLSVPTIYGKVHAREIPFSKPGKRLFFSKAELTEWVKSGRYKTGSELEAEADAYATSKRSGYAKR